jgi:hypothetical protein
VQDRCADSSAPNRQPRNVYIVDGPLALVPPELSPARQLLTGAFVFGVPRGTDCAGRR